MKGKNKSDLIKGVACCFSKDSFYKQVDAGFFTLEDEEEFTTKEIDELFSLGINVYPLYQQYELFDLGTLDTAVSAIVKEVPDGDKTQIIEDGFQTSLFQSNELE